ncbi:Exonuclease mut-7-like protein [Camelus dromedarius]|uniref:Exonuclease mut-7-like protein n=1 Tax=Camelus dromedarius TaxID=9838 RepID=A0A5N4EA03_CAMDR|nr:Exonuclease mut-7-like protein [Camelus dromedarius]
MDPGDPACDPASDPATRDPTGDPTAQSIPTGQDPLLFLQSLQMLWSTRELRQLREEAWRGFAALDDPLTSLLDMLDGSQGWRGRGPSLEAWVACELKRWLQTRPRPRPAQGSPGLKQLQARAVRVLAESPPSLVEPLVSIFQLQDADRSPLLAHIHRLHQEGRFKEAVVLGTKLQLQPDLDFETMSTPLLLQDKVHLVERYVDSLPDLQQRLLALLDSWCQPGFDIRVVARVRLILPVSKGCCDFTPFEADSVPGSGPEACRVVAMLLRRYPQVTSVRLERLSPRELSRQVLHLLERYGLDPALCPNVITQQHLAALRYLCHKRLVEVCVPATARLGWWQGVARSKAGSPAPGVATLVSAFAEKPVSGELGRARAGTRPHTPTWIPVGQGLVGQNQWLQEQLLQLLTAHNDAAVVARCVLDLSLPTEQLPATVATELNRLRLQEGTTEAPFEDREDDHYQLPIAREDIHFLASWEALSRHQEELLQPGQVVGVDLEWRPSFCAGGRPRASLMQVAVEGRVFLLDLPELLSPAGGPAPRAFSRLVSQLLSEPSVMKLGEAPFLACRSHQWPLPAGYGMAGDLRSLGASYPALAHAEKQLRGSLDLLQVHKQMRVVDMPAPGVDGARGPRGLSLLVQQVLGKPLDKTQQLSNWDRRPLGEGQLVYAATDAYCLLEVYWALCREPARFHLSGDLARSLRLGRSDRSRMQEPPRLQKALASPRQVPAEGVAIPEVRARAFRVVCDSMLQGLARSLRCLGVDVLVLGAGEDHRRAAEVARQEGRVILTSGLPYQKLRAQVGAGRCLSVDCSLRARQQAKAVLRHFNVRVTPADIFSRCQSRPAEGVDAAFVPGPASWGVVALGLSVCTGQPAERAGASTGALWWLLVQRTGYSPEHPGPQATAVAAQAQLSGKVLGLGSQKSGLEGASGIRGLAAPSSSGHGPMGCLTAQLGPAWRCPFVVDKQPACGRLELSLNSSRNS